MRKRTKGNISLSVMSFTSGRKPLSPAPPRRKTPKPARDQTAGGGRGWGRVETGSGKGARWEGFSRARYVAAKQTTGRANQSKATAEDHNTCVLRTTPSSGEEGKREGRAGGELGRAGNVGWSGPRFEH